MRDFIETKKFAEDNADLYKLMMAYSQNETKELANAVQKCFVETVVGKVGYGSEKYGEDKNALFNFSNDPLYRAFADATVGAMIDAVLPDTINPSLGLIAETVNVDFGDVAKFDMENNGMYAVAKAGYRTPHVDVQVMEGQTVTVAPEDYRITLQFTHYDILSGRKNIAKEVMRASKSLASEYCNSVWSLAMNAAGSVASPLKVTNFAKDSAIELAERVSAWNNADAVFVGTPIAISQIIDDATNGFRYTFDEANKLTSARDFNGFSVMPTPNFADYKSTNYGLVLDNTKIFVLSPASDKLAKVALGSVATVTKELEDGQKITLSGRFGSVVATNAIVGVIEL